MIKVNTKALAAAMQAAARVAPARSPSEALLHARLFTEGGGLHIEATDYDVGGKWTAPCDGEIAQCGVKAADFSRLIKSLRGEETTLSMVRGRLCVESDGSKAHLPALDGRDVPRLPARAAAETVTWDHADLCAALASTLPFAGADETRPELMGVHFADRRMESADGHTASVAAFAGEIPRPITVGENAMREVMAMRGADRISASPGSPDGQRRQWGDADAIWIVGQDCAVYARLIHSSFPDLSQVIPPLESAREGESICVVDAESFRDRIKQAALFSDQMTCGVVLDIRPGEIVITAQSDRGDITDTQAADVKGSGGRVRVNWRYLIDAIKAARSPSVRIRVAGDMAPILVQPSESEGRPRDVVVVMPMRM